MFYVDYGVVYGENKVLISKSINEERERWGSYRDKATGGGSGGI